MIAVVALLAGCSNHEAGEYGRVSAADESELRNRTYIDVPYDQLLYTKTSAAFSWEQDESGKEIGQDIRDQYGKLKNAAPGGFIVKETANEYYICISAEEKSSSQEGFSIQSLSLLNDDERAVESLIIQIEPTKNEQVSGPDAGKVFVTSLVSIAKKDLPMDANINEISMTGS